MRYGTFSISSGSDLIKVILAELAIQGIPPTDSEILQRIRSTNFIQRIVVEAATVAPTITDQSTPEEGLVK